MKIENINKAERLFRILEKFNNAITDAEKMVQKCEAGRSPIHMREHTDGSGDFDLELIYGIDGGYDKDLYSPIAVFTLGKLKDRRDDIKTLIKEL